MAARLVKTAVHDNKLIGELSISKKKLAAFLNAMGGEVPEIFINEDVSYGDFLQILGDVVSFTSFIPNSYAMTLIEYMDVALASWSGSVKSRSFPKASGFSKEAWIQKKEG
jgi:hypothetical protein